MVRDVCPTWGRMIELMPPQDWKDLYGCLGSLEQYNCVHASMEEAAAFMKAYTQQGTNAASWDAKTPEERAGFLPGNMHEFILERTAWHTLLQPLGLCRYKADVPKVAGECDLKGMNAKLKQIIAVLEKQVPRLFQQPFGPFAGISLKNEKCLKSEAAPLPAETLSSEACADIQSGILRPWPTAPLKPDSKLHWGALLHHLVAAAADLKGHCWPEHICILCSSSAESLSLVDMQANAQIVLAVLCTESHWALLACRRNEEEALLFDGLQKKDILAEAEAFLLYLSTVWKQEMDIRIMPLEQKDDWSCGHRVLLAVRLLLRENTWPPALAADALGLSAVLDMCAPNDGRPCMEKGMQKAVQKHGPAMTSPNQKRKKPPVEPPGTPPPTKRPPEPLSPEVPKAENPRKRSKAHEFDDFANYDAMIEATDELVETSLWERKNKKRRNGKPKSSKKDGAEMMKRAGISYNKDFQELHKTYKIKRGPGHWDELCQFVARKQFSSCEACQSIQKQVWKAGPEQDGPEETLQATAAEDGQDDNDDDDTQQGSGRQGRGRPQKGQAVQSLEQWLEEERPGVYTKAQKNYWWCTVCECMVHCHREAMSGNFYIKSHEKKRSHFLGDQRRQAGV